MDAAPIPFGERRHWTHKVRGYAGPKHDAVERGLMSVGDLLLETVHAGYPGVEIQAWESRLERGDASRVEVFDLTQGSCIRTLYGKRGG